MVTLLEGKKKNQAIVLLIHKDINIQLKKNMKLAEPKKLLWGK